MSRSALAQGKKDTIMMHGCNSLVVFQTLCTYCFRMGDISTIMAQSKGGGRDSFLMWGAKYHA